MFVWDEDNKKWSTQYPNIRLPTAWYPCSSVPLGINVIVASGIMHQHPWTMTRAVEVLQINEELFLLDHVGLWLSNCHMLCAMQSVMISYTLHKGMIMKLELAIIHSKNVCKYGLIRNSFFT